MDPNSVHTYHVNYDRLKKGNVKALFLNVGDYDLLKSSAMIDAVYDLRNQYFEEVALCTNFTEIIKAAEQGKLTFILSVEGHYIFKGQVDLLKNWHRLGIRIVNLTNGEGIEGFPENEKLLFKEKVKEMQKYSL